MTPADLKYLYSRSLMALELNLEGITHAESLIAPAPAGNCVNWVLVASERVSRAHAMPLRCFFLSAM